MLEISKMKEDVFYMSCVQWDEMLANCIELAEYSNEEVVDEGVVNERKTETIVKNVEEPNDSERTKRKTTKKKNREKILA
jgi:hypothetical protein